MFGILCLSKWLVGRLILSPPHPPESMQSICFQFISWLPVTQLVEVESIEIHRPRMSTILPLVWGVLGDSHREPVAARCWNLLDVRRTPPTLERCREALDGQEMNGHVRWGINAKTKTRSRYCESRKCRLTGGKKLGQKLSTFASNYEFVWQWICQIGVSKSRGSALPDSAVVAGNSQKNA